MKRIIDSAPVDLEQHPHRYRFLDQHAKGPGGNNVPDGNDPWFWAIGRRPGLDNLEAMGRLIRYFDFYALLLALALSSYGVLAIASATADTGRAQLARNQATWIALGLVVLIGSLVFDYRRIVARAEWLYAATTALLFAILAYGQISKGAQRWLDLGIFRFQPSEIAKVTLALAVAKYAASLKDSYLRLKDLAALALLTATPMTLVALQPDLGTAITFAPIALAVAFLAGIRMRYWVILVLLIALAVPTMYIFALKPYQRERIHTFLDPSSDPQGAGWQVRQSMIAIGSGGMMGKGYQQGSQTRLQFVPEQHTDFVFTVWAEELGFMGTGIALATYILLLTRVVGTAAVSRDKVGAALCVGFAGSLAFQALANLCMIIGLLPPTGIPLPLMSYGGTSALTTFMFLGLVMNVRMRRYELT